MEPTTKQRNIISRVINDLTFDSLNNIVRWNNHRRIMDETVAHHCYIVSIFANFIVEEIFKKCQSADIRILNIKLKVARASLFHEKGEIFSGDLSHIVKYNEYNGLKLRELLDDYINLRMDEEFPREGSVSNSLIRDASEYYESIVVKNIVKLADWLSSLYYLHKEISLGNNNFDKEYKIVQLKLQNQCTFTINSLDQYNDGEGNVFDMSFKIIEEIREEFTEYGS
jgi:5'-deoxynucleotidase YfbR-like HD superfamily hydrolase